LNFLAQDIVKESVPIRCLEAVVLAMRISKHILRIDEIDLTNELKLLKRFVMSFKSEANGSTFRHIVLVVKSRKQFGALGNIQF
jgi:hypothetical protein